jgi:predicted Zn-dependent protease
MTHYRGMYNVAMGTGRGYDIFPRTFKARLLLVIAFVGGLSLTTGWVALLVLGLDSISGPFELPPCSGSEREGCLEAQTDLVAMARASCEGSERRVCFVPLGQVDPDLVRNLVKYYRDEYGLEVGLLTPSAIPADMTNPRREQIDGESLADYMGTLFPADFNDPNVVVIGLTPLDLYAEDRDWNFELGYADWSAQSRAVVSTYRMHLGTFHMVDNERVFSRTRKLVTKYIGLMFYHLPLSDDPTSPMYGNILRVTDLDKMEEPLFGP